MPHSHTWLLQLHTCQLQECHWGIQYWLFVTVAFSTTCGAHIVDCEGRWLSGCHGSVAEHWRLKPVSWVRLTPTNGFFTFLYFHLITSIIFSMREDALSIHDKQSAHKHWKLSQSKDKQTTSSASWCRCTFYLNYSTFSALWLWE